MSLASYAESFEQYATSLPEPQRARRRAQFERFLDAGFPTPRIEAWHYTDLAPLAEQQFSLPGTARDESPLPDLLAEADHLVYRNGQLDRTASTAADLHADTQPGPEPADSVTALNAAFTSGGLQLRLGRGQQRTRALQVVIAGSAGRTMTHQRHRIELADNAQAMVIFQFVGHAGERLGTQVIDVVLAPGARLNLYRVQDEQEGATLLTRIDARLDRDSRLHAVTVDCGGGLVRHDFNVNLAAPGAEVELNGLYRPAAGAHLDNHTRIIHAAPHCRSRERYKGIVEERARAIFVGKVKVEPGAQKTDSEQHVANLLLSKKSEVDAKPELEIYADDVKCAHGATVGQLDDVALEYLRSRGIATAEARALLLRAFGSEVLEHIALPALREQLATRMKLSVGDDFAEFEA